MKILVYQLINLVYQLINPVYQFDKLGFSTLINPYNQSITGLELVNWVYQLINWVHQLINCVHQQINCVYQL